MSTNDLILAIGVTCCLFGVMLRGQHQAQRRSDALRAQTARLARLDGREDTLNAMARPPHPLVRHLPLTYRSLVLLGFALTVYGYARR